jgi:hypothetical protein
MQKSVPGWSNPKDEAREGTRRRRPHEDVYSLSGTTGGHGESSYKYPSKYVSQVSASIRYVVRLLDMRLLVMCERYGTVSMILLNMSLLDMRVSGVKLVVWVSLYTNV